MGWFSAIIKSSYSFYQKIPIPVVKINKKTQRNCLFTDEKLSREWKAYLEDPGLLFEVLIFIRLSIRKVVNLDTMFIDLIQNLTRQQ